MKKITCSVLMVGLFLINFGYLFMAPRIATAATLSVLSDTVSTLTTLVDASHVIKFTTPTGIAANRTVILTFNNSTSTTGVLFSDVTITAPGAITVNAGAPLTTNWGFVNTSSTVLTFTTGTGTVAPGSIVTITFNGTNKINNGSAGTTVLQIGGNFGDVGTISMAIVTNGVVQLSAEVLSTLTFSISDNDIFFGNLKSSGSSCWAQGTDPGNNTCPTVTETAAFNLIAATNATTGYTISLQGDTLKSGANSIPAMATKAAPTVGTEQFGIRATASGSGTGAVASDYTTAGQYALTSNATTPVAFASVATPSLSNTYAVSYMANIAALTKAGSYTTAHTYIATGNF